MVFAKKGAPRELNTTRYVLVRKDDELLKSVLEVRVLQPWKVAE